MLRKQTEEDTLVLDLAISGKSYEQTRILGPIRLRLRAGRRCAITGASGIGKSTLLRIIAGLDHGDEGSVIHTERIAMVFQSPTLLAWRSALDNICLVARVSEQKAQKALDSVGLEGKETFFPRQLSLGQQRRLSLARALASGPDLMLMDEPFASLDPVTAKKMVALTRERLDEAKLAAIIVTHAREEVVSLAADRIVTLSGAPATIESQGIGTSGL